MTTPADLLKAAKDMLDYPDPQTAGLWPKAAALLARQALETGLDVFWTKRAPGVEHCSTTAQLICLPSLLGDQGDAARVAHTWAAVSRACHHHAYELPPTNSELRRWIEEVELFLARSREDLTSS